MPKHRRSVSELPVDFSLIQSTSTTPPASHGAAEEPQTSSQEEHSPKRARTDTLDEVQMEQLTVQQTLLQPLSEEDAVFNDVYEPSSDSRSQASLPATEHYSSGGSVNSEDEEDESSDSAADSQGFSNDSFGSPESSSAPPSLDEDEEDQPSEDEQDYYNPSSHFSSEHSEPPSPSVNEDEWPDTENAGAAAPPSATSAPASSNQCFEYQPGEPRGGPEIHLYHNYNQPRAGTPRPVIYARQWPNSNTHSLEQERDETPPASPNTFLSISDLLIRQQTWQGQTFVNTLGAIATDASHPEAEGASDDGLPPNEGPSWWI